jgi:hypothetical protein
MGLAAAKDTSKKIGNKSLTTFMLSSQSGLGRTGHLTHCFRKRDSPPVSATHVSSPTESSLGRFRSQATTNRTGLSRRPNPGSLIT